MEFSQDAKLTPPPGVISSLKSGFDAVANHITVLLLPVMLDLFLWFGTHLRIERLMQPLIVELGRFATGGNFSPDDIQRAQDLWTMFSQDVDIMALLRTFPIGVTSLMSGILPANTPLGQAPTLQVDSFFGLFGWIGLLTVVGWILGGAYFAWVSIIVSNDKENRLTRAGKAIVQACFFSLLWAILLFALGIPGVIVFSLFFLISPLLAQAALLFFVLFAMWLIVPLFFAPHGIFTDQQNVFRSVVSSLHLSRFTMPTSSMFVLGVFLLSQGLNMLWSVPSDSSWMMLIGIFGHAFITTGLLAASFIYYRNMNAWLQVVLEQLDSKTTSAQA
ncbi:MAG: hypothetical protein B6I38_01705 [Anaerolineaceae bacterium 4572_5.1]|nr:MAG: hypothetical protein B6I38_01705 [Anaerolineaceae bacterium 4572_5.1]